MLVEILIIVIDLVEIESNSLVFVDEFIVYCFGFILFNVEGVEYFFYFCDCDCEEYCENCSVKFMFYVKCIGYENMLVFVCDLVFVGECIN